MPLGQRVAHMAPEGSLGVFDPLREAVVGTGDGRLEVKAGIIGRPRSASTHPGHVAEDEPKVTQTVPPA